MPTRVDFYVNAGDKLATAARLTAKAWTQRMPLTLYAPDAHIAASIDKLLWTREQLSFLPHCRDDSPLAAETPIIVAASLENTLNDRLLINLAQDTPPNFSRFERVIEIVGDDEEDKIPARQRFKFYRDRGYEINNVDLKGGSA